MTVEQTPDLESIKARIKSTWMAGNYSEIAPYTQPAASQLINRLQLQAGTRVLDVACGNGNVSLPAAMAGASVTGVDIAPNLLEQAQDRARQSGLQITFVEGDAEALPFADAAFDVVVSMFGAMFAPRPINAARELCRVCRQGGRIVMANWTPTGFIGELFRATGRHVTPASGIPSPLQWGDETMVRERFGNCVSSIEMARRHAGLELPFSVRDTVEFYRMNYGPTQKAFAALEERAQQALRQDLESLYGRHNRAGDGSTMIDAEFLECIATRS